MDDNSVEIRINGGDDGETTVRFWHDGQLIEWTRSHAQDVIGGVKVPAWVSQRRYGKGNPDMFVKVAVREGGPEVVELSLISQPGQRDIRRKHLRDVDVEKLAAELYSFEVNEAHPDDGSSEFAHGERMARKFVERHRRPRDYRIITDSFLQQVAGVYRANIQGAPTKAVAKHFQVGESMASKYVTRARQAGYIPRTKQGQKKA